MKKIFIIEDNENFALQIKKALDPVGEFKFFEFTSVERALGKISEEPDFIILDHFLDKANGIDCIPIFREFSPLSKIAIVSSQSNIELFQSALDFGADEYFFKDAIAVLNIKKFVDDNLKKDQENWLDGLFRKLKRKYAKEKKIWILDDNESTSFSIEYKLREDQSNSVTVFNKASKFMDELAKQQPDILILDYYLDDQLTGMDILTYVKKNFPSTKIIMLSGQRDVEVALKLIHAGASYYLIKSNENLKKLSVLVSAIYESSIIIELPKGSNP